MRIFLLLFLSSFHIAVLAQGICQEERYLNEVFNDVEFTSGIEFGNADPYGLINNQTLRLDIYEPKNDTLQERPVLIHAFGGGFLIGFRSEPDIPNWGTQYAKRGFVFVSIDYRLGFNATDPGSPIRAAYRSSQDMRAALRFLKDNATSYRLDMDHVFLTGSSAGCFAALIQTFMNETDRPQSTYGTFLEPQDLGCANCSGNNNNNNQEVPVHGIVNNWGAILDTSFINTTPDPADKVPVISFHGTNDLIVPYGVGNPFNLPIFPQVYGSEPIHHRLDQLDIYNRLYTLNGLGHEPELLNPWVTDTIVEEASEFLYPIMQTEIDSIAGRNYVCSGDTNVYTIPAFPTGHYCWSLSGGTVLNENRNEITVAWGNTAQGSVSVKYFNEIHAKTILNKSVSIGNAPSTFYTYTSEDGLFEFLATDTNALSYQWTFGDGDSAFVVNPHHQYADTGQYVLNFEIENQYCSRSKTDTLVSDLCPVAEFTVAPDDSAAVITNTSDFGHTAFWDFGNGEQYQGFNPLPNYSSNGYYDISLILSNDFCTDTFQSTVQITHCPIADFEISKNGLQISLGNQSSGNFFNYWAFDEDGASRQESPSYTFDSTGIYTISLVVFNEKNCSDTLVQQIYVEPDQNQNGTGDSLISSLSFSTTDGDVLQIFPLPAHQSLYFKVGKSNDPEFLTLYDLKGKVWKSIHDPVSPINLSQLPSAIYVIEVKTTSNIFRRKVLVRHP